MDTILIHSNCQQFCYLYSSQNDLRSLPWALRSCSRLPMDISRLIEVLKLEEVGERKFVGHSLDVAARRIFGGQIVAQAIIAAHKGGDTTRRIHSAHANFLRPGNPSRPIEF